MFQLNYNINKIKMKPKNKSKKLKKSTNDVNLHSASPNPNNGIGLSKQLAQKFQTCRTTPNINVRSTNTDEPRVCGNGRPMPSLAELEQMFEDSDSEPEQAANTEVSDQTSKNLNCSTPKSHPMISIDRLKSPNTVKSIAEKMLEYISSLPSDNELRDDDGPPPRVIPPKKRKKSDIPYIVGCKDRPKVPSKPSVNFCKGDAYGIDKSNVVHNDDIPKPKTNRTKTANISKSIFNAQSDVNAAHLRELDSPDNDLNDNIPKNFPANNARTRSFSPIPSTSRDSDIIIKNDNLFSDTLISNDENNINVISEPSEIIVIEDTLPTITSPVDYNGAVIVIDDTADECTNMTDSSLKDTGNHNDVEIIECIPTPNQNCTSPIVIEDYNSIDLNPPIVDILESIDVDEVIAESNAIIKKYGLKITLLEINRNTTKNNIDTTNQSHKGGSLDIATDSSANNENEPPIVQSNVAQLNNENNNKPTNNILVEPNRNTTRNNVGTTDQSQNGVNFGSANNCSENNKNESPIVQSNVAQLNNDNKKPTNNVLVEPNRNTTRNNIGTTDQSQNELNLDIATKSSGNNKNESPIVQSNVGKLNNENNNEQTNIVLQEPTFDTPSDNVPTDSVPTIQSDVSNEQQINHSTNESNYNTEVISVQRPESISTIDLIFPRESGNYSQYVGQNSNLIIIPENSYIPPPMPPAIPPPIQLPTPARIGSRSDSMSTYRPRYRANRSSRFPGPVYPPRRPRRVVITYTPSSIPSKPLGLNCPICMDDLSENAIASTICGHVFCVPCIENSLILSRKRCPTCRKALRFNGYHQIFL